MKTYVNIKLLARGIIFIIGAILLISLLPGCDIRPTASQAGMRTRAENMQVITANVPVPIMKTAQERIMVKRRAELFDVNNKLGYVYLIANNGVCIGYYSIFGKMASLQSYMVPQQEQLYSGSSLLIDSADLDGTYGDNMPGVFFFTDNGTYVEIPAFGGLTPIYSDKPLPLQAVKFN
jgi:hypothetical protein